MVERGVAEAGKPASHWRRAMLLVTLAALATAFGWWAWQSFAGSWRPDVARYPVQGVAISGDNEPVSWAAMVRQGARFAYIDATEGAHGVRLFSTERLAARAAGLPVGAIHHFDICALASEQAAAFVTLVPRETDALPPAVLLDMGDDCPRRPSKALLLTELTTFLTQVETHMGKTAMVSVSPRIEADYALLQEVGRPVWLRRNRAEPRPEDGEWALWQANDALAIDGAQGEVRWLVANGELPDNGDDQ